MSTSNENPAIVPVPGSSLRRVLALLNDTTAPIQSKEGKSSFLGKREGPSGPGLIEHHIQLSVQASQPIAAVRGQLDYFDTFNSKIQSQLLVWQRDLRPGQPQSLEWTGKVDPDKFATLLTFTLFFEQVRMADGSVWRPDSSEIAGQIRKLNLDTK